MDRQDFILVTHMNGSQLHLKNNVYNSWLATGKYTWEIIIDIISVFISDKEFPYKKYHMPSLFSIHRNLVSFKAKILTSKFEIPNTKEMKTKYFHFHYLREGNYVSFKDDDYYLTHDIICDFFNEDPRVRSIGYNAINSPMDYWTKKELNKTWIKKLILSGKDLTSKNMREAIYEVTKNRTLENGKTIKTAEARQSKVTTYLSLFQFLNPKKVLDMASAYGERMLASLIHSTVECYYGVDPNVDYIDGYNRIRSFFSDDVKKIVTLPVCSETIDIFDNKNERVTFDLALISPAPFDTEIYSNSSNQASALYITQTDWIVKYLFMTIYKAYVHLEMGGRLCITILDRIREDAQKKLIYTEVVCLFCLYVGFTYEGVLGWSSNSGVVPFWTFVKNEDKDILLAETELEKNYPTEINMWKSIFHDS